LVPLQTKTSSTYLKFDYILITSAELYDNPFSTKKQKTVIYEAQAPEIIAEIVLNIAPIQS